jgi:hypothetical protein
MKALRNVLAGLFATIMLIGSGLAVAADAKKPDGTVAIEETEFALILGGSVGGGKLTYKGKVHEFKIDGLTAGVNVGVAKTAASGEVFDLTDLSKFPGKYVKFDAGAAYGGMGGGLIYLKNEHGVVMKLKERSGGLQLNVASASGVKITMK